MELIQDSNIIQKQGITLSAIINVCVYVHVRPSNDEDQNVRVFICPLPKKFANTNFKCQMFTLEVTYQNPSIKSFAYR